jgi:predicted Zn-dependent peptidase
MSTSIFTLSNGFKVVFERNKSKAGHLGITFHAGTRFDPIEKAGLAHFLEHCIFKGTKKRKAFHILTRLDAVGGEINAYTTKEDVCIYASFVKSDFSRASELISDICFNSIYPEKEIVKEKEVVIDEIHSYLDAPSELIYDDFEELMFKNHPLGKNILGTVDSVRGLGQADLNSYAKKYFNPDNAVISLVGNFSEKRAKEVLEKHFTEFEFDQNTSVIEEFDYSYQQFSEINKKSNYQAHILMGNQSYPYQNKNRRGMVLLNNVLGGPALNSRLNLNIREREGIAYNIESSYTPYSDAGFFSVYLGTDKKNIDKCIDLIHGELRKLREVKLGKVQLSQAKQQLKGQISLSTENYVSQMLGMGKSYMVFGTIDGLDTTFKKIDTLTAEHIQDIANEVYAEETLSKLIYSY